MKKHNNKDLLCLVTANLSHQQVSVQDKFENFEKDSIKKQSMLIIIVIILH